MHVKKHNRMRFVPFLLTFFLVVMMAVPTISMADQQPVSLGTTSSFAVLAGSTITNTGATTISGDIGGDVGLYPGTAFSGQESATVSGAVYLADVDGVASMAQTDLVTAYNDAAGRTPDTTIPPELGGTTLTPGTYNSTDGTFQITGILTLDAQGDPNAVFIFQADSTLTTASGSSAVINGAPTCQIIWKVGSSATLGTNSSFVGHIFAMDSITATTGATVQGQLLALNGAVTLDSNTITNGLGTTPSPVDTYAVTVEWGDMTFNYDFGTWNPDNHTWGGESGWKPSDFDGTKDQVKITNHSTQPINATFSYEADQPDGGTTTGTFTKESGNLNGEATDTMTIPADDGADATYLNLQGGPASIGPAAKKVGTITVKIGP